jgi:hypothetical protein
MSLLPGLPSYELLFQEASGGHSPGLGSCFLLTRRDTELGLLTSRDTELGLFPAALRGEDHTATSQPLLWASSDFCKSATRLASAPDFLLGEDRGDPMIWDSPCTSVSVPSSASLPHLSVTPPGESHFLLLCL